LVPTLRIPAVVRFTNNIFGKRINFEKIFDGDKIRSVARCMMNFNLQILADIFNEIPVLDRGDLCSIRS